MYGTRKTVQDHRQSCTLNKCYCFRNDARWRYGCYRWWSDVWPI